MPPSLSNLVITFMIHYRGAFLLVKRVDSEKNFPGYWAFPGGRALIGETVIDVIKRKIPQETGLNVQRQIMWVDTYSFKFSTGITVLVRAASNKVNLNPNEISDFVWVKQISDLQKFRRVPGIDNHLVSALASLKSPHWQNMDKLHLTQEKFLNR